MPQRADARNEDPAAGVPSRTSSDAVFLERHYRLKGEWNGGDGGAFSWIDPHEQWALHHFLLPCEDLSDEELIAHRHAITLERPELPTEADDAYQRLLIFMERPKLAPQPIVSFSGKTQNRAKASNRAISVRALVRPEIDMQKLVRALSLMAEQEAARKTAADRSDNEGRS